MPNAGASAGGKRPVVVVVGSINADLVVRLPRLPGPGETVLEGTFHRGGGGKGANQAAAAAGLGARAVLVGNVGPDDLGAGARADLEAAGVDVSFVGVGTQATGVALILVDAGGENLIGVADGANMEVTAAQVADAVGSVAGGPAVVLAGLEVPDEAVLAAAKPPASTASRSSSTLPPAKPVPEEIVALCDVLTPNLTEIGGLGYDSPSDLLAAGAGAVVVTLGAQGVEVHRPGEAPAAVPRVSSEGRGHDRRRRRLQRGVGVGPGERNVTGRRGGAGLCGRGPVHDGPRRQGRPAVGRRGPGPQPFAMTSSTGSFSSSDDQTAATRPTYRRDRSPESRRPRPSAGSSSRSSCVRSTRGRTWCGFARRACAPPPRSRSGAAPGTPGS